MAEEDPKGPGGPISLSFSGSGFLVNYQIGVVQALWELAPEIMRSTSKVYGASCGSVVAAAVACDVDIGKEEEFFHEAMEEARKASSLTLCPGYRMLRIIEKRMRQIMSENSHQLASGKLCISLTRLLDLQNVIISEYRSKEELIQVMVALFPMYLKEEEGPQERYMDGGMTNVQPGSDSETMITVSPYTGEVDICPRDFGNIVIAAYRGPVFAIGMTILYNAEWFPLQVLHEFYLRGYHDAVFFLQRHSKCYKDW
uniref:PNPLA domain-containing protein n=1 Tax=Chelonoidis abingdonii TaxID=106734 RepID=A0A8C0GHK1_CHEAB